MFLAVVVKESPNINEEFLMQNLKSKLPVYMLPTKIIFEDKLPVGKNAKQDRKEVVRWIKAHEDRNIENEEKLTPCETRMLKIWKRLLGNDNITKKDNYFVCGGDSLLAVRMTAEIEAEFGVKVSIGIIFENNTVESLAKRISSIKEKRKPNIEVVQHNEQERFQEFLTTEMQYAYWIGRQNVYALGNVSSYCYYEIVSKNLSIERLERAWNELIIENDALRLVFSKDGKRQKVLESVPYYNLKVYNTDLDGKETVESISIYCVACCIPAAGETMSDILKGPLHSFASFCAGKIQVVKRFPKILALAIFGNGMNKKQREKLYSSLCGESTNLLFERINECKLETSIKWILPTKDRALNPKQQRVYMNNIGNIKSIIKLTAPHDVMISHPEEVAKILLEN